jgi:hypothetical protein
MFSQEDDNNAASEIIQDDKSCLEERSAKTRGEKRSTQ